MKKLIVFYSLGGNTRAVARKIAQTLKADVLEIKTVKTYPDDYDVLLGLGQREVATGYIPQLKPYRIDFSKYDAVLIGTPVWWSSFAPAIKSFIGANKWKGVKVYPFATNEGTLGHTPSDFRKALRGATVAPVLNVKFNEGKMETAENDIKEWLALIK